MSEVIIKTVNRKTTISKAAINKAAKIAYRSATNGKFVKPQVKTSANLPKLHNKFLK